MSKDVPKPFEIAGADERIIEIPPGAYYFNAKARCRRMMQDSLSGEARRVYACLELATMGFQQELAVTMEGGRRRSLTPTDVARQTGLSRQNVRRALAQLETAGLVERRGTAEDGSFHKGTVEIYSWAEPRPSAKPEGNHRAHTIPEWFPAEWESLEPLIRRLKLRLVPEIGTALDSLLPKGKEVAAKLAEAENVAKRFLKGVCAQTTHNKEERTERTNTTTIVVATNEMVVVETLKALAEYGMVGEPVAEKFQEDCRERSPDITDAECAALIRDKGLTLGAGIKNPLGVILTRAPELLPNFLVVHRRLTERRRDDEARREAESAETGLRLEYQQFRKSFAVAADEHLNDSARQEMTKEKTDSLRREGRLERMAPEMREQEITALILRGLEEQAPPYAEWLSRRKAAP